VTFSLLGRCARTGQLGACTVTSDIAVGARVPHARASVGAVLTQHRTDPLLGIRGLELLQSGCGASTTIDALVASTSHHPWRQLAVVDSGGRTAAFSGSRVQQPYAEEHGDGCVALGNMLVSRNIGPAMTKAFAAAEQEPLAERLLRALEAGEAAGGERLPTRSAALLVVGDHLFPLVDLRIDLSERPVRDLRHAWTAYRPLVAEFLARAVDPDHADAARCPNGLSVKRYREDSANRPCMDPSV
jgi:uncharacterized Ntn-hydrolase superfamily protein